MRYAILINNVVDNIILLDSPENWPLADNESLVKLETNEWCTIGAIYTSNNTPRFEEQTKEES